MRNIWTSIVKDKTRARVLLSYVARLREQGLIHEHHVWTHADQADIVPQTEPVLFRTNGYAYSTIKGIKLRYGGEVTIRFKGKDAHILLHDLAAGRHYNEIVLGAWNNTGCAIRKAKQGNPIFVEQASVFDDDRWNVLQISCDATSKRLVIILNDEILSGLTDEIPIAPVDISVSSWTGSSNDWSVVSPRADHIFDLDSQDRETVYSSPLFSDPTNQCVLIFAEDTVAFLDIDSFERFINSVAASDSGNFYLPKTITSDDLPELLRDPADFCDKCISSGETVPNEDGKLDSNTLPFVAFKTGSERKTFLVDETFVVGVDDRDPWEETHSKEYLRLAGGKF